MGRCPLCQREFPDTQLITHASSCNGAPTTTAAAAQKQSSLLQWAKPGAAPPPPESRQRKLAGFALAPLASDAASTLSRASSAPSAAQTDVSKRSFADLLNEDDDEDDADGADGGGDSGAVARDNAKAGSGSRTKTSFASLLDSDPEDAGDDGAPTDDQLLAMLLQLEAATPAPAKPSPAPARPPVTALASAAAAAAAAPAAPAAPAPAPRPSQPAKRTVAEALSWPSSASTSSPATAAPATMSSLKRKRDGDPPAPQFTDLELPTFDPEAIKTWHYPGNYPERAYQRTITEHALFKNTLVSLPTGLGKTFIAGVVMYNFYRWFPMGKIVFLAPTKPLATQQAFSVVKQMGFDPNDVVEMTGTQSPQARKNDWTVKRVFFLTPQVLQNDLTRGTCPAKKIVCVVVDEAHKAAGQHAYCTVISTIRQAQTQLHFRVLALSATPGADVQSVQEVINNLMISHLEVRDDSSLDVHSYVNERVVEVVVVDLGADFDTYRAPTRALITNVLKRLTSQQLFYTHDPDAASKFMLLEEKKKAGSRCGKEFTMAIGLIQGYETLLYHGLRPFHNYFTAIMNGEKDVLPRQNSNNNNNKK